MTIGPHLEDEANPTPHGLVPHLVVTDLEHHRRHLQDTGRLSRYLNEWRHVLRMAMSPFDIVKLAWYTALFHLGNRLAFCNTNRLRSIRCRCNGRTLVLRFRQNVGDLAVFHEILGAQVYSAPYERIGPVNTIIDLGAHIGFSTLFFATQFPSVRLVSVEPVKDNFVLLQENCDKNGVQATLVNACISSTGGEVQMSLNPASHMHTAIGSPARDGQLISVPGITMADILADNMHTDVDLLKVDIEGAEGELFRDCGPWISRIRCIIIEIHPGVVDYAAVVQSITSCGFVYYPPGTFAPLYDIFIRADAAARVGGPGSVTSKGL